MSCVGQGKDVGWSAPGWGCRHAGIGADGSWVHPMQVLTGLGGVGKTTLARAYALDLTGYLALYRDWMGD
jgi:hypothetical protein